MFRIFSLCVIASQFIGCIYHNSKNNVTKLTKNQQVAEIKKSNSADSLSDTLLLTLDTINSYFNVSNYESADREIALEREPNKLEEQICNNTVPGNELSADSIAGSTDTIADSYIVSLKDSTPESQAVDSIDVIINKINAILFYSDKRIKKMQDFDTPTRIDYMQFLIKNQLKSIDELQTIVTLLLKIKKEEKAKNSIIMQRQTGNIRETIHKYIQKINKDMDLLSAFMLKLSSREPIVIKHGKLDSGYFISD